MAGGKVVGRLKAILGLDKSKYDQGLKGAEKSTSKFSQGIKKLGGIMAGAFAVTKIIEFAKESAKLAGIAEGIQDAYSKIDGTNIDELRKSVKGTVSDMDLMRNTVVATTLGLKASKMPELFAFAAQRANETGESVQFLVDSIVKGIGRKSPLILDNLGISAIALKEAMGGLSLEAASVADVTEAVAKIAKESTGSLDEMGEATLTAAQKTQQLESSTTNLKVAFGNIVNAITTEMAPALTELANAATTALNATSSIVSSKNLSGWQKFIAAVGTLSGDQGALAIAATEAALAEKELSESIDSAASSIDDQLNAIVPVVKNIGWYKEEVKKLKESLDTMLPSQKAEMDAIHAKIAAYDELIKSSKNLRDVGSDISIAKVDPIQIKIDTTQAEIAYTKLADMQSSYTDMVFEKESFLDGLRRGYFDRQVDQAFQLANVTMGLLSSMNNMYIGQKDEEIKKAQEKVTRGIRSEDWFAKESIKINKKYAKKQKNIALAMAIINTAQGVTKALADGGPVGILTGLLVAAAGAAEIATISSQGMKTGGIVPSGFPNDSYPAMLTSGETVIPPKDLPNMMNGGGGGELKTRISGRHLEIVLERWAKDKNRIS